MAYIATNLKGVTCRDAHALGRGGKRFLFRIGRTKHSRERTRAFDDFAVGLDWARGVQESDASTATATKSTKLLDCLKDWEGSRKGVVTDQHMEQVRDACERLAATGADDLADPSFGKACKAWLSTFRIKRTGKRLTEDPADSYREKRLALIRCVTGHAVRDMEIIARDPTLKIRLKKSDEFERPIFRVWELKRLLSESARYNLHKRAQMVRDVVAECGSQYKAAKRLGLASSTVCYFVNQEFKDDPYWFFTLVGAYTGMRNNEIAAMEWGWIDWVANVIVVPAKESKNKKVRYIRMMPELRAELEERQRPVPKSTKVVQGVSPTVDGRSNGFRRYVERVGLDPEGRTPHGLRAGCGAMMVAMGCSMLDICLHLGHENPRETRHYSQLANLVREEVRREGWTDSFTLRGSVEPKAQGDEQPVPLAM